MEARIKFENDLSNFLAEIESGAINIAADSPILDSIRAIKYHNDGSLDLNSVNSDVIGVIAQVKDVGAPKYTLHDMQSAYFEE